MDAEREIVDICALSAEIEDSDLWVGDTTVESGLRVWLKLEKWSVFADLESSKFLL